MITPVLHSLFSMRVVDDLYAFSPADPTNFGVGLMAFIGTERDSGQTPADAFDFFYCTPRWLADSLGRSGPRADSPYGGVRLVNGHIFGRGLILTAEWCLTEVEAAISEICQACAGEDWPTPRADCRTTCYGSSSDPDPSRHSAGAGRGSCTK